MLVFFYGVHLNTYLQNRIKGICDVVFDYKTAEAIGTNTNKGENIPQCLSWLEHPDFISGGSQVQVLIGEQRTSRNAGLFLFE